MTQLEVAIPKDAPLSVLSPFAGRFEGAVDGQSFSISYSGLRPKTLIAQRDAADGRVWFLAAVTGEQLRGTTLSLEAHQSDAKPHVTIESRAEGFQFFDDKRPVLFYQREPRSKNGTHTRADYVHPLIGLDGEELTQDFPADHLHHRGVFWAWHQLWIGEKRAGNPWLCRDFLAAVSEAGVVDQGPVFGTLKAKVNWTSPLVTDANGQPKTIVAETTFIRLYHAIRDVQFVDFEISLSAQLDGVAIGGSEDGKGYSGFTVRVNPPAEMLISTPKSGLEEDALRAVGRWADVSGRFGGKAAVSGITILSHPSLPQFPPHWLLRYYGMQNVMYPGEGRVELPRDKPLVLRHRLVIHRGSAADAKVNALQALYESTSLGSR